MSPMLMLPSTSLCLVLTVADSYDSFKIFMGLPTTGGPAKEQQKT